MTVLILGGTGETRQIAHMCMALKIAAVASLAGATRSPKPLPIPTRSGGFGGETRFAEYLQNNNITAIIDATHPFAAQITARSYQVATQLRIPIMRFERPPWHPNPQDTWVEIGSETDAAKHIPNDAVVFLATGRQTLRRFSNLSHARLICRQIDPPTAPFPFPNGEFLIGRPPFSETDEYTLFKQLGVDHLVVKNAGGAASRTKLDAAAALGIPVLMIKRPAPCGVDTVDNMDDLESWLRC